MHRSVTTAEPVAHPQPSAAARLLRPGDTCWRLARADRFAVIVDAAEYFAQVKAAMLKAQHSILLIGWDFDLRIRLTPDGSDGGMRLGAFLKSLVKRRPGLHIHILKWDMAVLYTLRWETLPLLFSDLLTARRIHLRLDSTHPFTAAHHQKIAVIDASIAFCGGIDMTARRWDTPGHLPGDERRVDPGGDRYGPWHDSATAVGGEAASALDDHARQRWLLATGQHLPKPDAKVDAWPGSLEPQMRNVSVGIARTMPAFDGHQGAHEIEALYLAAIGAAKHSIYIESQFFACARIADSVIARLREPNGPEIIVINPESGKGWLDRETMDIARALILKRVRAADFHNRFRIYYPVNEDGQPIYVHSKVLIVDDCLLRVGSSNINNRSMGFDSECDLAVEGTKDEPKICEVISDIRNSLLAEHLGTSKDEVSQAIKEKASVLAAVDSLCTAHGRTLRSLPLRQISDAEQVLAESRIANPERPTEPESRIEHAAKRLLLRHPVKSAAVGLLGWFTFNRLFRQR